MDRRMAQFGSEGWYGRKPGRWSLRGRWSGLLLSLGLLLLLGSLAAYRQGPVEVNPETGVPSGEPGSLRTGSPPTDGAQMALSRLAEADGPVLLLIKGHRRLYVLQPVRSAEAGELPFGRTGGPESIEEEWR